MTVSLKRPLPEKVLMKNTALVSLCVVALAVAACGGGNDDDNTTPTNPAPIPAPQTCGNLGGTAILNGAACSADTSSIVLLNMRASDGIQLGACSGTIITKRKILTAAHCLDQGVGIVRVWLGSGPEIVAQSFVHYPGYVFNQSGFDVGVVFMADDLPRNAVPVLLGRDARVGETAIIAGWGRDQNNETATLRSGSTTISAAGSNLLQTPYAPPSSSVCQGDSGGPIMVQEGSAWTIAGITSATSNNVCNTGTNFYQAVRQPDVTNFIRQHAPDAAQR